MTVTNNSFPNQLCLVGPTFIDSTLFTEKSLRVGENNRVSTKVVELGGLFNALPELCKENIRIQIFCGPGFEEIVPNLTFRPKNLVCTSLPELGNIEATVIVDSSGERTSYVSSENFTLVPNSIKGAFDVSSIIYLDFYSRPELLVNRVRESSKIVMADLARNSYSTQSAEEVLAALKLIDYLVCSESEAIALSSALGYSSLIELFVGEFASLTFGACIHSPSRLLVFSKGEVLLDLNQSGFRTLTTKGAGDRFLGRAMVGISEGRDFLSACLIANNRIRDSLRTRG